MTMPASATDILDAIPELQADLPPETFEVSHFWLQVGLGSALAVALAALALFFWLRRRSRQTQAAPTPEELALRALDALGQKRLSLRDFSIELSMLLREYLTGETQDPALFETHEEFSLRFNALESIPAACRRDLFSLLEELAAVKYAPGQAEDNEQCVQMLARAREIIVRIAAAQHAASTAAAPQHHS